MHLLLPLAKGHLTNVTTIFVENRVALLEGNYGMDQGHY